MVWRVGEHYDIHIYEGDRPVATFLNKEDAKKAVQAVNNTLSKQLPLKTLISMDVSDHSYGSFVEQIHRVITTDQGVDRWVIAEEIVMFIQNLNTLSN